MQAEGAVVVGVTAASPLPEVEKVICERDVGGRFAGMKWLGSTAHKRADPADHLPGAKSIICTAWPYSGKKQDEHFARYALHADYHKFILEKLKSVWREAGHKEENARFFVDSKPIAEKAYAARAKLGWIGKNGLLINSEIGSFFCLGLIITDSEFILSLSKDEQKAGSCGDCRRCIDACPTGAIVSEGEIDCNRCISYLTTEHKGDIPHEIRQKMGGLVFGCDICQEACPYNDGVKSASSMPVKNIGEMSLSQWAAISEEEFCTIFDGTPIVRLGIKRFIRNVTIAIDNDNDI